jgi:hypothetical protein
MYLLGEFGQKLTSGETMAEDNTPIQVSEKEIIDIIDTVFHRVNMDDTIKEYGLTCLMKLYTKF